MKEHWNKHKTKYFCIGSAVIGAGITCIIMRSTNLRGGLGVANLRGGLSNAASFIFSNKQTINVVTVLDREGRGHPGWPVRNLETKRVFFSQGEAARAFDISESMMSGHLNGKFPEIDGLHFERVNLGA